MLGKGYVIFEWPALMRSMKVCPGCGVPWRYKMSMMELVGWTMVVCCFPWEIMNGSVVVQIDNEGTIWQIKKGYDSKCVVVSSLLRTTYEVARGLNAEAFARKVSRCSARGPVMADQLSKGLVEEFMKEWTKEEGVERRPREVPPALKYWLEHPSVDGGLSKKILRYMRRCGVPVLQ